MGTIIGTERYFVEYDGQRFLVGSLQEASEKWDAFRERTGAGASELGRAVIYDERGVMVAKIMYNGRVILV